MKLDKIVYVIGVVSSLFIILALNTNPKVVRFNKKDKKISKSYKKKESISITTVSFISVSTPLILFFTVSRILNIDFERELEFYISFLTCQLFMAALVENFKNICGRLRPDFLDRCRPMRGVCTGNNKVIREGRRSFPSGHSATAACGFSFASLFVGSKFKSSSQNSFLKSKILKGFLLFLCILFPLYVGFTRYIDNRHHISDVLGGFLFGIMSSLFFYNFYSKRHI